MTRDEAVSQIQLILGKRTDLTSEIITQLQFAQKEAEKRLELPIFLRSETLSLTSTPNVERMTPPTGFLREWDEDALYVQEPNTSPIKWNPLDKDSPRYLRSESVLELTPAIPEAYAYDGTSFILFPTPDLAYTFRMIFYKADDPLTSNIENKWLANIPYLFIGHAGSIIASAIMHKEALALFSAMFTESAKRLDGFTPSRDGGGRRYIMGGPD